MAKSINYIFIISFLIIWCNGAPPPNNGRYCGTKVCLLNEYCSNIHSQCESCTTICTKSSHNYDHQMCSTQCQDYLNSQRFGPVSNYEDDIKQIKKEQQIILIVLVILLLIYLIKYGIKFTKWIRNNSCIKFSISKKKNNNNNPKTFNMFPTKTETTNGINLKRDEIERTSNVFSISGVEGSTAQTISTPISTRYPAENSTTEYSYDNAALQVTTPGTDKTKELQQH